MKQKILLHSCCAPCLTGVYEQLKNDFDVTVFWFNPNISPIEEYEKRLREVKRYCKIINIPLIIGDKIPEDANSWELLTRNLEEAPEGGKRCKACIKMRLLYAAEYAKKNNFDQFATTLSVSPHKNTYTINNIGKEVAAKINLITPANTPSSLREGRSLNTSGQAPKSIQKITTLQDNIARNDKVRFLDRDFKKNDGYKRSIEICREYNIYRQKYCGCGYSTKNF